MCHMSIWPKLRTLKNGAGAGGVDAVLGLGADPLGVEVLLGQVAGEGGPDRNDEGDDPGDPGGRRLPRHAAMKNLPHRWMTMKKKKTSTLHRCREFTKRPTVDTCHQVGPKMASTQPVRITQARLTSVSTPKT